MSDAHDLEGLALEHWRHALSGAAPERRLESFLATPAAVQEAAWGRKAREAAEDIEHLRDPLSDLDRPARAPRPRRDRPQLRTGCHRGSRSEDDPLLEVDAATYFEVLAGVEVPPSGMVRCPLPDHDDRTPSCSVTGTVWHCFGCQRSGRIYDLGAELWGFGTRGTDFIELRQRLAQELLGAAVA